MILRFEVNQAEAFRQGVDVSKSTNHIQVDPAGLPQAERDLIADRLAGIDVCRLEIQWDGKVGKVQAGSDDCTHHRILAKLPTYEALLEAVKENQAEIEAELKKREKAAPSLVQGTV
jgi:ribosome-binding ATPase YchF (GTP1/OBG family)